MRRAVAALVAGAMALVLPAAAGAAPNDPGFAQQWGLRAMRAVEAWPVSRGAGIVVAVVDTGVDASHPDLSGHVLGGKDFVDDDNEAGDEKGHGTHVAGTIAAVTSNEIGVASVAPLAKILPVRVLAPNGEGDPGDVAAGIRWAVDHGAKIVNLSLAQDETDGIAVGGESLLRDTRVDESIRDAARRGALVVVAAGNSDEGGRSSTAYDARVSGVLVVGATTRKDERAAYSNYGAGLDLVAPGGGSATDARACTSGDWIVSTWWNPSTRKSDYGGGCGTSMAVAHVSGLGALLMARGYTNAGAVRRMTETAVDLASPGRDDLTGYGRIDARSALGAPPSAGVKPVPNVTAKPSSGGGPVRGAAGPSLQPTPSQSRATRPEPAAPPVAIGPGPAGTRGRDKTAATALAGLLLVSVVAAHARRARAMFSRPAG